MHCSFTQQFFTILLLIDSGSMFLIILFHSQDPVLCSVTVGVSHFERCALWVQVLYYPFYGSSAVRDYEGDYAEEDPQIMRQKRSLRPELGEPVILRCQPYKIPLTELLLPLPSYVYVPVYSTIAGKLGHSRKNSTGDIWCGKRSSVNGILYG